jgi:hypothetical protein
MPKGKKKGRRTRKVVRSRRRRARPQGIYELVRSARSDAAKALGRLRSEIAETRRRLEVLIREERDFLSELSGKATSAAQGFVRRGRRAVAKQIRKGPAQAEKFFAKLPERFTLEEIRKLAGRLTGVSLAQWSRAKKIRKVGGGYAKQAQK